MTVVFLGLGSNLGDRRQNLVQALRLLSRTVTLRRISGVYETEPVGFREQPLFLNCAAEVCTRLSPRDLLALARRVEDRLGRERPFRNSPRTIDIDILVYGVESIHTEELTIPHPRITERAFVLVPLAEIAPDLLLPGGAETVADLAARVDRQGVKLWGRVDITLPTRDVGAGATIGEGACTQ